MAAASLLHIVALPLPLQGHINPLLHLLARLCGPDLITTLLVPQQDVHRMQRSPNPHVRVLPLPPSVLEISHIAGLPSTSQLSAVLDALEEAEDNLAAFISGLGGDGVWSSPICCILLDSFVEMGQDLADRLKLPRIAMWTASAATFLINCNLPQLISRGMLPFTETSDPDSVIDFIPGIDSLSIKDIPSSLLTSTPEGLERRSRIFSRNKEAACIFLNTVEELERKVVAAIQELLRPAKFLTIGPLLPSSFLSDHPADENTVSAEGVWKEDMHCLSWLDEREPRSVLYVSFGSMATLKANQIEKLALGLESSGQPFLWVMRPNLVSESEAPNFCEDFVVRTKSQGLVISWAPQLQVLKHPSVGGFLTHCGWNSTLEAVCSGVPLLCWPCFAEQHLNCKIIVDDWKVGLSFFRGSCHGVASKEVVHQVIRRLMVEDPGKEIRKRAIELRNEIRSTVTEGGSSDRNLSAFVDLISKRLV
ncbi:UDP-glycosyltransferase 85A1 [Selaginella moellendorffii]|uniref:UDP-glycosyltransferase 85A1 n=1 Tax=Selaginella moellendorffii TaxID=88036 RepID=UPI000D1C8FAD|nr:UDP-glycosyltransferase 85A1 [Selaginella moellendorffii]|eukprot:XP_024526026.1 UDP-glycosyltransferase 85A1 [Selaginella moellendorffii]